MATSKKMTVPDIGGLLGKITEKREAHPKTPIQSVQPVDEPHVDEKAVKPASRHNAAPAPVRVAETRGIGGRPTLKKDGIEYVKVSPRIPKYLKQRAEIALVEERFRDADGRVVTTFDELTTLALEKILQ
jgi:hypothetical protein